MVEFLWNSANSGAAIAGTTSPCPATDSNVVQPIRYHALRLVLAELISVVACRAGLYGPPGGPRGSPYVNYVRSLARKECSRGGLPSQTPREDCARSACGYSGRVHDRPPLVIAVAVLPEADTGRPPAWPDYATTPTVRTRSSTASHTTEAARRAAR